MKIFNKEFSKIGEAAIVLAFFTFLSQILGIFRDRFLAGQIGTGEVLDLYYAAFRIPDLVFVMGAALVSVSIVMPFFEKKKTESKERAQNYINQIFTSFSFLMILVSIILYFLLPLLNTHLFPGFDSDLVMRTTRLSRIMLLSPLFLGISSLFSTIVQSYKKFLVYAIAPIFYNVGIILGIVFLFPLYGEIGLALGVVIGALMHLLIQAPVVWKQGLLPKITFSISWSDMKKLVAHSLPRTLTLSLQKIVFLVFVSLASTLLPGAISVFNLSYNLQSVPLAIIGVSYSVAAFPTLVAYYNEKNFEQFIAHVMGPIRQIVFWSLPVISLFIVLRAQIVRVILGSGQFDWSDTRLTAAALALFIISVLAQSINLLIVRAYYASGKTWKPLWIGLCSSGVSILFGFFLLRLYEFDIVQSFFEKLLRLNEISGSAVVVLALAFSIGAFLQLSLLIYHFRKDFEFKVSSYGIKKNLRDSLCASLLIGFVSYHGLKLFDPFFSQETVFGVLGHGFSAGLLGIIAGALLLFIFKNEDFLMAANVVKRKFLK